MFSQLFSIIAPVVIVAAIGFLWQRFGAPFDMRMVTNLVTNIGAPCLIVATLGRLRVDMAVFWDVAALSAASVAVFFVFAAAITTLTRQSFHTFTPALCFANTGNLGLPLCLFAFGDTGLALGIAWFAVTAFSQFTLGQIVSAGSFSFSRLARTPIIYAVAVSLVLMATGTALPTWLQNTVTLLGEFAIPLMLLALGVSLASLRVRDVGRSVGFAAGRLIVGLVVGVGMAEIFGLTGAMRGIVIIQSAMPAAVFNYLWAQHYGRDAPAVAGVVFVSTLMTFAALPLITLLALDPTILPWR